jgi:hypothetical protein
MIAAPLFAPLREGISALRITLRKDAKAQRISLFHFSRGAL